MRFEVLTVVGVQDVCLLVCDAAYFRKEQAAAMLVLQDGCFKMAAAGCSDTPVPICQTARHYVPKYSIKPQIRNPLCNVDYVLKCEFCLI